MHRRRYLALAASGLAGAAGCLSRGPGGDDPGTISPTNPPDDGYSTATPPGTLRPAGTTLALGETYEDPDGWSLTVSNARVRRIGLRAGTHLDPVTVEGGQYVLVDLAVEGDANGDAAGVLPDPAGFDVALDGADATPEHHGFWTGHAGRPTGRQGTMATPVTTAAADVATVRYRGGAEPVAWRLAASHREAIANAPAFEVRGFELPEVVDGGSTFEASLTVANVGDRDGRFLAELGATTISDTPELAFDVPAGGTVEHVETVDPYVTEEADDLRIVLNWGAGRLERTVAVE